MVYITPSHVSGQQIRAVRKSLGMTQKEFAEFAGCSKPTIERWERGDKNISGPITTLLEILKRDTKWPEKLALPENKLKLRLFYMFEDQLCTLIDADEVTQRVEIKNFTDNIQFRAFGRNTEPTYHEYEEFLESRCFPKERDKMKLELERLGIPFYDPIMIIKKTEGRMAEDHFWIRIER
ncbi:MAG: helix-turn-helix domain-containing protein [Lachnospiraceae bacterium]|nr:helix-turn-helix domain-containing protein [Lachnospiraceae bacterium]